MLDDVDPHIRFFVDNINAGYAAYPNSDEVTPARRREIAEQIREPWRKGGPEMAETLDFDIGGVSMRLHRPVDAAGLPAMLYIHGGGWALFSIDTHDRLMREYAARAGIAVIGIDYSLSPEAKFPVALDEVVAALLWIREHAEELSIDESRLAVGGDSAGANLAVAACLKLRELGHVPLQAMILNYGAFAPEPKGSYERYGGPAYCLEVPEMDAFWANYVSDPAQLADPLVAPLHADLHGLPPAFIAIAECDILADCNQELAEKLASAGVSVKAVVYHRATHSFLEAMSIAPLAQQALADQALWLRRTLSMI
ncbi:MAG: alpha/beta hydrolase [Novosphingobium sp.]|nr:alpha/beta hydrolase [Novosphingobium sp.]